MKIDPVFISSGDGWSDFKDFVYRAKNEGLKIILDLVINHTANENNIVREHPEWYKWENDKIKHPGCLDNGRWIEWGDLSEINNEHGSHLDDLYKYWENLIYFYLDLGADGFRCDSAYQVPPRLWLHLIGKARKVKRECLFFAETLECSKEQIIETAKSGFDYIFNSLKWWNFYDKWCMENYWITKNICKSISFPESHDTLRLSAETNKNKEISKQRYLFSCLFSSGVMMPIGFEYGSTKKLHVVYTTPNDLDFNFDISNFISRCNELKSRYKIFQDECDQEILSDLNSKILILKKELFGSQAIIALNKTSELINIRWLEEKYSDSEEVSVGRSYKDLGSYGIKILVKK